MTRPIGFWIACAGAFLLPLVYTWNTYDRYVLPKLLFMGLLILALGVSTIIGWAMGGAIVLRRTPIDLPLLALVGAAAIATLFAINHNIAIFGMYFRYEGLLTIVLYALLFWLTAQQLADAGNAGTLIHWLLASAYLVALVAIVQSVASNLTSAPGSDTAFSYGSALRAFATFGNPNFLGVFFAMLLPVALGRLLRAKSAGDRVLMANLLVVMILALLLTFSRSAWLAAAVGMLAVLVTHGRQTRMAAAAAAGVIVVAIAVAVLARPSVTPGGTGPLATVMQRALSITQRGGSTASRLGVWQGSLRVIASRPLVGYGPDNFGIIYPRYRTGNWAPGFIVDKAHNEVLQIAATEGLLGLAAYAWLVGALARAFWGGRRHPGAIAAAAGIFAYILWVQVNFSFIPAAAPWWLFAAGAVALWANPLPASTRRLAFPGRVAVPVAAAVGLVAVAIVVPSLARALIADFQLNTSVQADARRDRQAAESAAVEARRLVGNQSLYAAQVGSGALGLEGGNNPGPSPDWATAAAAYREAARLGTDNSRVYYYLALADQALGRRSDAIDAARAGLHLNPGDPGISALLAQISAQNH